MFGTENTIQKIITNRKGHFLLERQILPNIYEKELST